MEDQLKNLRARLEDEQKDLDKCQKSIEPKLAESRANQQAIEALAGEIQVIDANRSVFCSEP
jgi:Tfp pilus assembly protein FimV